MEAEERMLCGMAWTASVEAKAAGRSSGAALFAANRTRPTSADRPDLALSTAGSDFLRRPSQYTGELVKAPAALD